MQGFHISPEKRRYGTHTYIYIHILYLSSKFSVAVKLIYSRK